MLSFHTEFREPNVSNVMVPTNLNIIATLLGVAKPMIKLTLLDSKLKKTNYILIHSSTPTAKEIIKQTQTHALSRSIVSTMIGTTRNNKNFMKTEVTQFTLL